MKRFVIEVSTNWCGEDNKYGAYAENEDELYKEYGSFYKTKRYSKLLTSFILKEIKEELISKVCTPKRILNWNEDVLLNKEHPLYGLTQKEIDNL